jgi:hypothetical protein
MPSVRMTKDDADIYVAAAAVTEHEELGWNATNGLHAGILQRIVRLSDAEIKALPTTQVELFPAPGVGKILFPFAVFFSSNIVSDYTNIGDRCVFLVLWNDETPITAGLSSLLNDPTQLLPGVTVLLTTSSQAWASQSPFAPFSTEQGSYIAPFTTSATPENKALLLNGGNWDGADFDDLGDFTGGSAENSLTITILYYVVDL